MLLTLLLALSGQASDAYPRDYPTAIQCGSMAQTIGLARGEDSTGPTQQLGLRLMDLAITLAPPGKTQEGFNADLVAAQNSLFAMIAAPSDPQFRTLMEEMQPELEKCEALLG